MSVMAGDDCRGSRFAVRCHEDPKLIDLHPKALNQHSEAG